MDQTFLLDVTLAGGRVRLRRSDTGFQVVRANPQAEHESVTIARWRFNADAGNQAATRVLTEALALGEARCLNLREMAQTAARRAIAAQAKLRAGSGAMRHLERDCVQLAEAYVVHGHELIAQCLDIRTRLTDLGLMPVDLPTPLWMTPVLDAARAENDAPDPV